MEREARLVHRINSLAVWSNDRLVVVSEEEVLLPFRVHKLDSNACRRTHFLCQQEQWCWLRKEKFIFRNVGGCYRLKNYAQTTNDLLLNGLIFSDELITTKSYSTFLFFYFHCSCWSPPNHVPYLIHTNLDTMIDSTSQWTTVQTALYSLSCNAWSWMD